MPLPLKLPYVALLNAELLFYARHSMRVEANLQLLNHFFVPLSSLPFDNRCADEYGLMHADFSTQGKIIGLNDLLIAAIARANDAALVAHNTKAFSRVTGTRLATMILFANIGR